MSKDIDKIDNSDRIEQLTNMTLNYPQAKASLCRMKEMHKNRQNKNTKIMP